jgi:hypothetical protein
VVLCRCVHRRRWREPLLHLQLVLSWVWVITFDHRWLPLHLPQVIYLEASVSALHLLTLREDPLDMLRSWLDLVDWVFCSGLVMGLLLHFQRAWDRWVYYRWARLVS